MNETKTISILDTGIKNVRNVDGYVIGSGAIRELAGQIDAKRNSGKGVIFFVDQYFQQNQEFLEKLPITSSDLLLCVDTKFEPTTQGINDILENLGNWRHDHPSVVVGIGGGIVMDTAKAVSNLLTNEGKAEDYQGWDLVRRPGIFKIAVPTISGTGAEATRTCVMTNNKTGLKLGMNSDYTVFDFVVMDPNITLSVPRDQYFWTGMDAYIHCVEALSGSYRNSIGDAFSKQTLELCRQVFGGTDDMQSDQNRERLMVASYLGGCAIATSYVGLVHPLSAGLSVVFGAHHCVANCMAMRAVEKYYPDAFEEFWGMVDRMGVFVPKGLAADLSDDEYEKLYQATVLHEKPLTNALGDGFRSILTKDKLIELFKLM